MAERLIANPKGKSEIWKHFLVKEIGGKVVEGEAACKECKATVKLGGGTSNLSQHMRRHHPALMFRDRERRSVASAEPGTSSSTCGTASKPKQMTLTDFGQSGGAKPYPNNSQKCKTVNEKVARFIVKDLQPFRVVESQAFKGLVAELDPRYKIPSRTFFFLRLKCPVVTLPIIAGTTVMFSAAFFF